MDARMDGWMMDERMDGWMIRWMIAWMNGRVGDCVHE